MLLVCPNCGARYEVPEQNIPDCGRDVQCSACSMTWFQTSPNLQKPPTQEVKKVLEDDQSSSFPSTDYTPLVDNALNDAHDEEKLPQEEGTRRLKNRLPPTVAEVLKEEAQREVAARATEILQTRINPRVEQKIASDSSIKDDEYEGQAASSGDGIVAEKLYGFEEMQAKAEQKIKESKNAITSNNEATYPTVLFGENHQVKKSTDETMLQIRIRGRARTIGFLAGLFFVAVCFLVYQQAFALTNLFHPLKPLLERYVTSVDLMRAYSDQWFANGIYWLEFQIGNKSEN